VILLIADDVYGWTKNEHDGQLICMMTNEQFLSHIATYYGTNVRASCEKRFNDAVKSGNHVSLDDILSGILHATRQVDLSKNDFKAKCS
jgi:hypothetical protein